MEDFIKELITTLRKNGKVLTTNKSSEIRVSCPYCKDRRHPLDPKMYVSLEPPFKFNCFRCDASGILNARTLQDFKVSDSDLVGTIVKEGRKASKNTGKKRKKINRVANRIENKQAAKEAIDYFNGRYGCSYQIEDADRLFDLYKMVLDANTFIKMSGGKKSDYFDYDHSIGFVSSDKSYAIFRSTLANTEDKVRYSNVPLINDNLASKMFTVGTEVDMMQERVQLVLAEGIFDIIGIYEHYYKDRDNKARIFAANCGKSYRSTIERIMRLGFLDLDIVIYSDGDVEPQFYRDMKENWSVLQRMRFTVYYNNIGKDYGVKKSEISLRKAII